MATLLDAPKGPNPAKFEEFVEKQLTAARRRVRVLDFFMTGLVLGLGTLAFFLAVQVLDRYVETPRGAGWAVGGGYLALAAGFVYLVLFRPSRRQINPYFAAHHVEKAVPNAKNSLVTWVDFEADARLPGSIKTAIGQKAYRDIKGVDLDRAIENRKVLWLAVAAGVLLLANAVVAFLPPTRTELTLQVPKDGDITVFSNQEIAFQARVHGRIPGPTEPDAVRLRMWYNPDDADSYEDRPMRPTDGDRREFGLTVPAKQVRTGFRYKVLAGNAQTPEYTVTAKILPEFRDFEVSYAFPPYLRQPPEKTNDPNLLAPYGTTVTVVVATTREVKEGYVQFEGQDRTLNGQLVEGRPDAIQFSFPVEKEGVYQVFFTTPEGDKNTDPTRFRITVIDPKPVVRSFDLDYDYPAYLRFKPMKVVDVREPEVEAPKGTKVVLTARTNRPVKAAAIELPGLPPVAGELLPDQPMWVRFHLPALLEDGTARVTFTPNTSEAAGSPRTIPIRLLIDQAPQVQITDPQAQQVELPANGTLELKGIATDDHGVDRLTLRMALKGSEDKDLVAKPYRAGMSFVRKEDNSWPSRVEYKDFVKIPDLRMATDPQWRAGPGMVIEYWLEALDNCTVPRPNRAESRPPVKTLVILTPAKPPEQKKIDQENQKLDKDQKQHEKQQDAANQADKRDVKQDPPKGAEKGEPKEGDPKPKDGGNAGEPKKGPGDPKGPQPPDTGDADPGMPPDTAPDHGDKTKQVEKALEKEREAGNPGTAKPDGRPKDDAKVEPGTEQPQPKQDPGGMPPAEDRTPKADPNQNTGGDGTAGTPRKGEIDKTPETKGTEKPAPKPMDGTGDEKAGDKPAGAGTAGADASAKPDTKPADPKMPPGTDPKQPDKGTARPEPTSDPKDPGSGSQPKAGTNKPDTAPTPAQEKPGAGEPGPMGDQPPPDAGTTKPKEREAPAAGRPPPKDGTGESAGGRPGPKEDTPADGARTPPKKGMNEEEAGTGKAGPGTPPPGDQAKKGNLDRELGELERELNSTKPEIDPDRKAGVERLMRDQETRQQTRDKLDELERNAKDPLTRQKAKDLKNAGEQAAKDYDAQKPDKEKVDELAKKLNSKNEQERRAAEEKIKDWEKDAQAKKDLQKEVDELKKKDRTAGEKVDDAMKKAEQARTGGQPEQKLDEKQLADMAKDLNSKDQQTREKAEKQMKDMAGGGPKAGQQMQDKLNQMAKDAKTPEDKQNLEKAAQQAGQMAKIEPKPKLDPKDLKDAADKLASDDPKTRQEGKDQLEKLMRDPKTRAQAKDMLDQMAKDAKTDAEKKKLEDAAKQADEMAGKEPGPKPTEKVDPKDLEKLAKDMAGTDPKAKEEAGRKMDELMKDPKTRDQAMEQMKEMAKNASGEDVKKALQEAMKKGTEAAKNDPPKLDPKDLQDVAKKFDQMDEKSKQDLQKKFDEAMKDPELQKEMQKKADDVAKNAAPEQKKQFDDMMKQMGRGNFQDRGGSPDPADLKNRLKAAELTLEDFKKNLTKDKFKGGLGWTQEQIDRWLRDQQATIDALRRQELKGDWRNPTTAKTAVKEGPGKVTLEGKDGGDLSRGGKYAPPAGYADPYKQFTIDAARGGPGKK